jgi:hypothetical protein
MISKFFSALGLAAVALVAGAGQGYAATCANPDVTTLFAGQTINVGTVSVCNDATNIYVTYTLTFPGATLGNLHGWVGNDLANLPGGGTSRPAPGQLCGALGGFCHDATGLVTYTFTIPFADISIPDITKVCNTSLYVVTHAEVNMPGGGHETAFGGGNPGPTTSGSNAWWFYGRYTITCDEGEPKPTLQKTAFAKGTWVWTTDKKSNPENLASLNLTRNRWGWAIKLTSIGTTYYDIWAGAGLNITATGVHVGRLTVIWDGTTATVTYTMFSNYLLQGVHLYAGDAPPNTIAPGQYGYLDSFDPLGASTYTFTVPLSDTNGDTFVWLVAHAVVSSTTF